MDMSAFNFDEIRPYNDAEAREAIKRVVDNPLFDKAVSFLFPDSELSSFRNKVLSFTGVKQLQDGFMMPVVERVLAKTANRLTFSGMEHLKDGRRHLLLSAHRDIILDPAIIQYLLGKNGLPYSEIAVGDNLLGTSFVEDCMRSNRMIKVMRGCIGRDKFIASATLSAYIRSRICDDMASVWIAHRSGRTKDGMDSTGQGVLKMLWLSDESDFEKSFDALSIIPVSISYEFESCDFLKAREVYWTRRGPYSKKEGEDMKSMVIGLTQWKGDVHFHFGSIVSTSDIEHCAALNKNERFSAFGELVDRRIRSGFKLWPNNYIAFDLLHGTDRNTAYYSKDQKEAFCEYMNCGLSAMIKEDSSIGYDEIREIFLSIYANPVTFGTALK